MNFIFHVFTFIWENFILVIALLFLTAGILRLYFNRLKAILLAIASVLVFSIGVTFLLELFSYTTFQEAYSNYLQEDTEIRQMTIEIHDTSHPYPECQATATIVDEELIDAIMDDFMEAELKREFGINRYTWDSDYTIGVMVTNRIDDGHLRTDTFHVHTNESHVGKYKVVNGPDYLETIERLVESDDVEWEE